MGRGMMDYREYQCPVCESEMWLHDDDRDDVEIQCLSCDWVGTIGDVRHPSAEVEMKVVKGTCPFCGKVNLLAVEKQNFDGWKGGKLIQEAFPDLSTSEREILLTGICSSCWDTKVGGE